MKFVLYAISMQPIKLDYPNLNTSWEVQYTKHCADYQTYFTVFSSAHFVFVAG